MMTSSYANLFGTTKKPNGKSGFPGDGAYAQAEQQQSAQLDGANDTAPTASQTFAQQQRQGRARPAPPAASMANIGSGAASMYQYQGPFQYSNQQAAQSYQGGQQLSQSQGGAGSPPGSSPLQQLLSNTTMPSPSAYNSALFNQLRSTQRANLEAEFGASRKALEEEMASRGLSASTIGSGRYGDLAGQQARAMASMDADLLQRAAETDRADRQARDQMFLSLTQYLSALTPQQITQLLGRTGGGNG